uniref:Uncharacterized protein n=1 Tax=Electrophorus electricus TaxID=8005 RepID=A0A4W4DZT4_ELEEL
MDSQIAKISQSLTTAEQMRNQTKLIMQPYANWEQYLTPAPLSIAIMGELVFISSQTDFSINKNSPKGGYKYIKYPESFRACLMQVCNSGWWAFNEAHKNMDQIRLHTLAVPDYMKNAVKILFQSDDEIVQAHLPDQVENIRAVADDCLALASETEKGFTNVINIIQELLEACINANSPYREEQEEIKNWKRTNCENHHQMKLLNALRKQDTKNQWIHFPLKLRHTKGQDETADVIDESAEIRKCTELIQQFVQEDIIQWKDLYDQKNKSTKSDFSSDQWKRINESLETFPQCKPKKHAKKICKQGINICTQLTKFAPDGKCEEAKTTELIEDIRQLIESARIFDSKSKDVTNSPALEPKPPMMFKEESKSQNQFTSQRITENAQFCIEQTRVQLVKTRVSYEKSVENLDIKQTELAQILIAMRNCEVKETDFNTTIKMLLKGMDAMGKVKEQWKKMVHFFQMVSNIVKVSLTSILKNFSSTSEKTQSLSYNAKLFSKDLLYSQAFQATNIASLVHMISTTYIEVSDKHLMDRISSLGKLMAMDKEKPEFEQEHQQLQINCDAAQKAILQLVQKNKDEFERKSNSRLEKTDQELLAILPSAAPEETKSIQAAVKYGFKEEITEDNI